MSVSEEFPPMAADGERNLAARLAEIKQMATQGGSAPVTDVEGIDEEEILAQAALGLAERRARRGDLVGTMTWERIAAGPAVPTEPAVAETIPARERQPDCGQPADDRSGQGVPAHHARQEGHDDGNN